MVWSRRLMRSSRPPLWISSTSLSVGGPAALLCSLLWLWLLSTLGPADRHQSPIGRRLDRFCPSLFWLFKSVKCRVNSGLTTIVVPVPQPDSAASIAQVFIESHYYIFKSICPSMLLHRLFVTRWPTLWLLYNNNNVPCPVCVCVPRSNSWVSSDCNKSGKPQERDGDYCLWYQIL